MPDLSSAKTFEQEVGTVYTLYNSLFLTLPFNMIHSTGNLIPFLTRECEEGIERDDTPEQIIDRFFQLYKSEYKTEKEKLDLLFRMIRYIERQVVLFDAIEESAFDKIHDMDGQGTLHYLFNWTAQQNGAREELRKHLQQFRLRLVLTAHPTQYYPASVLGIITDLREAIRQNKIKETQLLLQQLGKTPFLAKQKPTPYDEAKQLMWYLEQVFYPAYSNICKTFRDAGLPFHDRILELGFWPGGDRDGNPYVTAATTEAVSKMMRQTCFQCYLNDAEVLARRLTMRGVEDGMARLIKIVSDEATGKQYAYPVHTVLVQLLEEVEQVLNDQHDGLFVEQVVDFKNRILMFGSHLATLDIRQDSRKLRAAWDHIKENPNAIPTDEVTHDTLKVIPLIKKIQYQHGERACNRFIISNNREAGDILRLRELFIHCGWEPEALTIDLVPLFETVDDLLGAGKVMEQLFTDETYRAHVHSRGNRQVIMLGFSDSTKDGGYLSANWRIYSAKVALSAVADKFGVALDFFDGRGGPPARGGGRTQQFYASLGPEIHHNSIQLTIQGQTISSQYGSKDSARYNIEQLLEAGLMNRLQPNDRQRLTPEWKELIEKMSKESLDMYHALREHKDFLTYLEEVSPLKLLSKLHISSRPVKRGKGGGLKLEDLRAISFVTSWSQLKQNVPGFFGMGTALKKAADEGQLTEVKRLYQRSGYFKALIDNCMMSLMKSDFRLTSYLAREPRWKDMWEFLHNEYELTKKMVLEVSGLPDLMDNWGASKSSIVLREHIILPLIVIQRYAWEKAQGSEYDSQREVLEKLALRTMHGIVNAGRNLA